MGEMMIDEVQRAARLAKWAAGMVGFDTMSWVEFNGHQEVVLDGEFTLDELRRLVAIWESVNEEGDEGSPPAVKVEDQA